MATFYRDNITIGQIIQWDEKDKLKIQPKFQRRLVWEEEARSYLIDTVIRELPMPKIYLRQAINNLNNFEIYEVVDGQQRLNAILEFKKNSIHIYGKHNKDYEDCTFKELPDTVQRRFLDYELSVEIIEDASDPDVWALFERLNTYTITLNRQERLNAKYFGYFKQACYGLAARDDSLKYWKKLLVFSDRQISRMKEVELTSDVVVAMIRGISDINVIKTIYEELDDEFPQREEFEHRFSSSLEYVYINYEEAVRTTRFRRIAWFYSLFLAVIDALFGIPNGFGPAEIQNNMLVSSRMYQLDEALKAKEPPQELQELHSTLSRSTVHTRERKIRHEHFFNMLTFNEELWHQWHERLNDV
jgi:hypothetical protein